LIERLRNGYNTIIVLGCLLNCIMVYFGLKELCWSLKKWYSLALLILLLLCNSTNGIAQLKPDTHDIKHLDIAADSTKAQKDSVTAKKKRSIFQSLLKAISKKHPDSAFTPIMPKLVAKSEVPFLPYKGKIIRHI